jgi:hypothetical protein
MKFTSLLSALLVAVVMLSACSEDTPIADPSLGDVNPAVYVAIGNSLTAGYTNGALYESAQMYSYPSLIAQALGTPEFVQPLIQDPGTGNLMIWQGFSASGSPVISYNGNVLSAPSNINHPAPFHNLGLPGAVLYDALDVTDITERATQRGNPFYTLIMRDQENFGNSLLDQAIQLNPTLLSFWLGNNDVLAYASSGGTQGTNTGLGGFPQGTRPTERAAFGAMIKNAFGGIQTLLPDTKVLVGNIPDPTVTPLFTTVPRKIPNPGDPAQLLDVYYRTSSNTVGTVGPEDYILLTAQAELGQGVGLHPQNPLPSQYVLDATEVEIVRAAVRDFNSILASEAESHGFALVDCNRLLNEVHANGYMIAGETYTTSYIAGGLFGLDGVHLTARGNAIVANEFIAAMNGTFGANIRQVPLHTIPGVKAPAGMGKRSVWSLDMPYTLPNRDWIFGAR